MTGGHSHTHFDDGLDRPPLTAARARRLLTMIVGGVGVLTLIGVVAFWPSGHAVTASEALGFGDRVDATVRSAEFTGCSYDPTFDCSVVTADVESGGAARLEFPLDSALPIAFLAPGDKIVLNDAGIDVPPEVRYSFADFQRSTPLLLLLVLFAAAVIALGRLRGLFALIGLAASLGVLLGFVLPALLRGSSPVGVALTGAAVIALIALYLAHGFNERTTVAVLGTFAALGLTAFLGSVFASSAHLTGLATEESINLLAFAPELDFRGLLLAAVIIGALGVLDDVTVTQVSAVWELRNADPNLKARDLYRAGIRIGRDHIASTVNTLVLAYSAAALPLLLLLTQSGLGFSQVITSETIAVEVVQTLVGSIGLVASVPITTALAAWVVTRSD